MTLCIPLDPSSVQPSSPSFVVPSASPAAHLTNVIQAVVKAKRIAVVCGAGISVGAGIPDFRSQDGLFQSLKRDNPKESLSSGKELFDAAVFKSKQKTALFYRMIARLSSLSSQGQPTTFHQLLRNLNERGQLLRVYTQNIDALEMKAGLSFGVPVFDEKNLRIKVKGKAKVKAKKAENGAYNARLRKTKGTRSLAPKLPSNSLTDELDTPGAGPSTPSRPLTPADGEAVLNFIPRCIPLHGTLLKLHCPHCTQSFPLIAPSANSTTIQGPPSPPGSSGEGVTTQYYFHSMLAHGMPPPCPSCTSLEETRALVGKRLRGVGKLRPSVVLYGEEHREGEGVGEVVRRDLCGITDVKTVSPDVPSPGKSRLRTGKGPDLLLVVGTSLRVPGTKRIVREFSKAVRPPSSRTPSRFPTPQSPPPAADRNPAKIQTVYLNLEFPSPAREWDGVFDVWVNGDAQAFARAVEEALKEEERREMQEKLQSPTKGKGFATPNPVGKCELGTSEKPKTKRKSCVVGTPTQAAKRRKVDTALPPTPTSLPKPVKAHSGSFGEPELATPSKVRKVFLRLPPQGTPSASPTFKRTSSIPEVIITKKPAMFASKQPPARSLSPLTPLPSSSSSSSLSSLTPPPPPPPPPSTFPTFVDAWHTDARYKLEQGLHRTPLGYESDSSEENAPLSVTTARREVQSHRSTTPTRLADPFSTGHPTS